MSRIKIKNFGPIKEPKSVKDEWIDIKKVTVFTGNQGSGKSTVAKLISTFTWMEKVLTRGDFKEKELPDQVGRPALFEFIESEIKGNIDLLDEVPAAIT